VFKFMASAVELMPVYDFVQGKSGPERYSDTYRGQIHPPTGKSVLDIITNLRHGMINELQLEEWLRTHVLDYHCLAATGVETIVGYDRGRDRVLTNRDGDGSVPLSSALPVPIASSRIHLKTLARGGYAHARLCERTDVQAYILAALRDIAPVTPQMPQAAPSGRALGEQNIQPDDLAAMARSILSNRQVNPVYDVGKVLSVTRLLAGDVGGPFIDTTVERVGTKLMLKNPPKHIESPELISVPRHDTFQYVWISSTGSELSFGGMLFLPKLLPPHGLNYAHIVTFNVGRYDRGYVKNCNNAHHAEMQLVGWIEKQPEEWRERIATVLISNRARQPNRENRGYSPCTACCDDLAKFLLNLRNLQSSKGKPIAEAGMTWLTFYTYAGICPSHPTTTESLNLMYAGGKGWKLGGPGWSTPPPLQPPIRRPARPQPVPGLAP
jgi:hypothetical protein